LFDVATNKKNLKGNLQVANKDKESDESPKLTFAPMEGKSCRCGKGVHKSPNGL